MALKVMIATSAASGNFMKQIILTGDDFGASSKINEAMERLHVAGLLTQASLMVEEPGVEEAVRIARRNPRLLVGLHLTVCTDFSGRYPASPTAAGLRYALLPWTRRALREAVDRQFARFAELDLGNVYWDGHTHSHLHPVVLRYALEAAQKHNVKVMRLVQDETAPGLAARILGGLSERAKPLLRTAAIAQVERSRGLAATGRVNQRFIEQTLDTLPEGWTELYWHPGAEPEELDAPPLVERMERLAITRVTSRDLAEEFSRRDAKPQRKRT